MKGGLKGPGGINKPAKSKKKLHPEALKAAKRNKPKPQTIEGWLSLKVPKIKIQNLLNDPKITSDFLKKIVDCDVVKKSDDSVTFKRNFFVKRGTSVDSWLTDHPHYINKLREEIQILIELNGSLGENNNKKLKTKSDQPLWDLRVSLDEEVNSPNTLNVLGLQADTAESLSRLMEQWSDEAQDEAA